MERLPASRADARAIGAKWYFTGEPCRFGHVEPRCTSNKRCRKCLYESTRRFFEANPGYQAAAFQRWRALNVERDRQASTAWQQANRAKVIAAIARREAGIDLRTPRWADADAIRAVYELAQRLSKETGIAHHVDHVIPLHGRLVSGLHVAENLRAIPAIENKRKSNLFNPNADDSTTEQLAA